MRNASETRHDPFQQGGQRSSSLIFWRLLQTCCWWDKTNAVSCKSTQLPLYLHLSTPTISFFFIQRYILFHKAQEHRVSTGLIALYATYQNQASTVISGGSFSFYLPAPLTTPPTESGRHRPCVLAVLTELRLSPYTWARYPRRVRMTSWLDDLTTTHGGETGKALLSFSLAGF